MIPEEKYKIKETFFCQRCNVEVFIPDFPLEMKETLNDMVTSNQSLNAIKYIKDKTELGLFYGKALIDHLNEIKGHCNRCSYSGLEEEKSFCPKCNEFNLNW